MPALKGPLVIEERGSLFHLGRFASHGSSATFPTSGALLGQLTLEALGAPPLFA
jgi:hypothetical protein